MKKPTLTKSGSGFSLVELLVVIAVIAIIAAIAIPNIAGITGSATTSKNQRNAQTIASAFNAARAAGYNVATADIGAAVTAVNTTLTSTNNNGIPAGFSFGGLRLSSADQTAAQAYLTLSADGSSNSVIEYNAAGSASSSSSSSSSSSTSSGF